MRRRVSSQSALFKERRRAQRVAGIMVGVAGVSGCIALLIALFSWGGLRLTSVNVVGVDQESVPPIRASVVEALQGEYIGLFPKSHTLIYPRSLIASVIADKYPEVDGVSIDRTDRHTLTVTVTEKKPSAVICPTLPDFNGTTISLEDPGTCYFADESGFIFKQAPSFTGAVYHRYYIPDLSSSVDETSTTLVGIYAVSTDEFARMHKFYDLVSRNGIVVDALLAKGDGEYELYVRNPVTARTAVIYWNTTSSAEEQATNLISFWKDTVNNGSSTGIQIEFDYIDIRYGKHIYHRLLP